MHGGFFARIDGISTMSNTKGERAICRDLFCEPEIEALRIQISSL